MTGKPFLTTDRLELWQPHEADMLAMHEVVRDPRTNRFLGPRAQFSDHAVRFMRNAGSWFLYGYGALMLRLRGQEQVIGNCGVFHTFRGLGDDFDDHPEAGWIVGAEHVGQGLAGEAMRAVLDWFDREHGPRRIVCMISPENEPSIRLAAKLGFVPVRETALPDGAIVRVFGRARP
ncbi:MAG TPA: GNAT family N-acetyltransferase [Croceibacterium sp.]|nr:GNAT family N-acetyltransferase [Croceibacterium sp.]